MHWALLILFIVIPSFGNDFFSEKFKSKKGQKAVTVKFSDYQTVIGTCPEGSSLGIYRKKITLEHELFYVCKTSDMKFLEIFPLPGLNNDSLLDFGFILQREDVKQLYFIFSLSDRLYHYEMVQELQNGNELADPDNKPPLDLKYLKFFQLKDLNGDGTPEFINNIFNKNNELINWADISDTLDLKKHYQESMKSD